MTRLAIPASHVPRIIQAMLCGKPWHTSRERGIIQIEIRRPARLKPVEYTVICCMEIIDGEARGVHQAVEEINRIVTAKREAASARPRPGRSKRDGRN